VYTNKLISELLFDVYMEITNHELMERLQELQEKIEWLNYYLGEMLR
jgi:hypothetical protein